MSLCCNLQSRGKRERERKSERERERERERKKENERENKRENVHVAYMNKHRTRKLLRPSPSLWDD